jgi:hypothetical protein
VPCAQPGHPNRWTSPAGAYQDGTTHIVMSPLEFMQRLAALVPCPRLYLIRFHGVLAPNAKLRAEIIPGTPVNANDNLADHGDVPITRRQPASAGLGCSNGCSISTLSSVPSAAAP